MMADPQHPAVPFEQAVDLLTGEPRPLRPQHPDIAAPTLEQMPALIAKHDEFAALAAEHGHDEMAALHAVTAAALRTLARPVEDEEVQTEIARCNRWADSADRGDVLPGLFAAAFRARAEFIARLAREKASAEQERDRFRAALQDYAVSQIYGDRAREALAAAAGAEEPR